MGAAGSRPSTPEAAREPPQREQQQEEEEESEHKPPEHDQSSPTLVQLPEELLCAICARLELASLSAVASTCHELERGIPDAVWQPHLQYLKHAGDGAIEDTSRCGQRITNSIQRQAAVEAASEAAESAAFLVALSDLMGIKSARLQVGALRTLVCNLCLVRPGSASEPQPGGLELRLVAPPCGPACACLCEGHAWALPLVTPTSPAGRFPPLLPGRSLDTCFESRPAVCPVRLPCLQRGVCRACVRTQPAAADSWRHAQSRLELAAIDRRDAELRTQLHSLLASTLPLALRGVVPRLLFSSDADGGSLATMLRMARGSHASLLTLTVAEEAPHPGGGGGGSSVASGGGGSNSLEAAAGLGPASETVAPPPPELNSILSPLALRDIARQGRRTHRQRADGGWELPRTFGAFCPAPWPRTPNERPRTPFGDATSLLFSLSPRARVHPARADDGDGDGIFFRCDGVHGVRIGGDALLPALSLSTDLSTARVLPCHTFGDLTDLAGTTDAVALVRVQLWDLTPLGDTEEGGDASGMASGAGIEEASVLSARRADAMMLPFRTSMMMRVE